MLRMPLSGSDPPSESDSDPAAETRPGASAVTWTRAGRGDRGPCGGGLSAAAARGRDEALPGLKPQRPRFCRVGSRQGLVFAGSVCGSDPVPVPRSSSPPLPVRRQQPVIGPRATSSTGFRTGRLRRLPSVAETDDSSAMPAWGPAGA